MYKVIFCAALCALNMYGMKQKQLIEKVIKHKRGLFCLDKILKYTEYRGTNYPSIIDSGKDLTDFLNESIRTKPHWFYDEIAHNPTGRLIYDPSVIYECGGSTGADLAYPFPEILIETAKPWLNKDTLYVEPKLLKKSKKLQYEKDQNDYFMIHMKSEDLIDKIGKRKEAVRESERANYPYHRIRIFPPLELSSYEKQALYRYDFDSPEHLYWRNNDEFEKRYSLHESDRAVVLSDDLESRRIERQKKILNNLLAHQRGLIIFNYLKSKNIRSDYFRYNIDLDQSIIYECGGNNITSILLPDPSLFTACITSEAFKELNTMKRRIESIHAQQEKDHEVYHRLAKENPLVFTPTNSVSFEDATALEAYGFYGKIALFNRNSSLYESITKRIHFKEINNL